MFLKIDFICYKKTQFFFDRVCFFSFPVRSRSDSKRNISFFEFFNNFLPMRKRIFKKKVFFPKWLHFNNYYFCMPDQRNVFFPLKSNLHNDFFFLKKKFYRKLIASSIVRRKRGKKLRFRICFNFFYYYFRKKNKKYGGRSFFFVRFYRRRFLFHFFKYLFLLDLFVSNSFSLMLNRRTRFVSLFCYSNLSLLFVRFLYLCIRGLRIIFFDFDLMLFVNKLFFFSLTRCFIMFPFIRKSSILINRLYRVFYICFRLNLLFIFFRYYKKFKLFLFKFFFSIRNTLFFNINFLFSRLIFSFSFFKRRSRNVLNISKFVSFLYLHKERLFIQRSYNFLFNVLLKIRRAILRRTSVLFIRSTTYNTYYTFVLNGRILYKKSAGMIEANRKCRLQYDVVKKMSDNFKFNLEMFLIRFAIKKLHVVFSGFKKFQRYIVNGLRIIRSIKKRKYLGAFFGYRRLLRKISRFSRYFESVLLKKKSSKYNKYLLSNFVKEYRQIRFMRKRFIFEIFKNKRFLFILDYIFLVSLQPFNGCRGRRLVTKRR